MATGSQTTNTVHNMTANISGAVGPTNHMNRLFSQMVTNAETSGRRMGSVLIGMGGAMTIAGSSMKGAFDPVTRTMLDVIKVGMEFESQMAVAMGSFDDGIARQADLMKAAMDVGTRYTLSNVEAAGALEVLGKAGRDTTEAIAELEPIVKFAEANHMDLAAAAKIVAITMTQFADQGLTATDVVNTLTSAAFQSTADVAQLGTTMNHAGAIAAGMGVPFGEFATTLAILSSNGIEAMKAGTAFRGILTRLISPTKEARQEMQRLGIDIYEQGQAGEASIVSMNALNASLADFKAKMPDDQATAAAVAALEQLGVSAFDSEGKVLSLSDMLGILKQEVIKAGTDNPEQIQKLDDAFAQMGITFLETSGKLKPFPQIMQELAKATEGMSESQRNAVFRTLATQTGMQALNALVGTSTEEWEKMTGAVNDGGKALDTMTDLTRDTLPYALEVLRGNIETLKKEIYDELRPAIIQIVQQFRKLVEAFQNASPEVKQFLTGLMVIGAIIGGVIAPAIIFVGLLTLAFQALAVAIFPLVAIFGVIGIVILALKDRMVEVRQAIEPAIQAFKLLKTTFSQGLGEGEASWLDSFIKQVGDLLIAAIGKAARAFQILIDTLITIRQVLNGTWESSDGIHPFTNAVGVLLQKFLEILPTIIAVASAIGRFIGMVADSRVGQAAGQYAKIAFLLLGLIGTLTVATGAVTAFALAIARIVFAGPLKGLATLNKGLNAFGLGFKKPMSEKDKMINNLGKLDKQTVTSAKKTDTLTSRISALGKSFAKGSFAALITGIKSIGTAAESAMKSIQNLMAEMLRAAKMEFTPTTPGANINVADKVITITQSFVTTGTNLLKDIADAATTKIITITQAFKQTGTSLLASILAAKDKTVTVTQKFVQQGVDASSGAQKGIETAGKSAGNKLSQLVGSAFGAAIGTVLLAQAPKLAVALGGLISAALGAVGLSAVAATGIGLLIIALVGLIVLFIKKPEYLTMIGEAIAWLFTTGLPYALGFAVGAIAEFATQFIILLIKGLGIAIAGLAYLVAGLFLLLLSPLKLLSVLVPPLVAGLLQVFNLVFIQLPILMAGIIGRFWVTVAQIFFATIQTLISLISLVFLQIPLAILGAFGNALSTTGGQLKTLFFQIISGEWGAALRTALNILKTIFITLPMEIVNIVLTGFSSAFGIIGGYLSTVGSLISGWLSSSFSAIMGWGGQLIGVIGSTIGNVISAFGNFLQPLLNVGQTIADAIGRGLSVLGNVLGSIGDVIGTIFNAIVDYVQTFVSNFTRGFNDAFGGDFVGRISDALSEAYDTVVTAVDNIYNYFVDILSDLPGEVAEFFTDLYEQVTEKVSEMSEDVQEFIGDMKDGVLEFIINLYQEATETFNSLVSETTEVISGWAGELPGFASDAVTGFIGAFASFVTDVVQFFIDVATGASTELGTMVTNVTQAAVDIVSGFLSGFATFVTDAMQFFLDFATNIATWIGTTISELTTGGQNIIQGLLTGMQAIWTIAKGWISGLPGQITSAIGDTVTLLYQKGWDIIQGLYNGVKDAVATLNPVGLVTGIGGEIANALNPFSKSPWPAFIQYGSDIIAGLVIGIGDNAPKAIQSVTSTAVGMLEGFRQGFAIASPSQEMVNIAHALIDGLIVGMDEGSIELAKKIAETVNSVIDAMSALIDFSSEVNATDILPLDPDKLAQLTNQIMQILDSFAAALSSWSIESLEGLGKKLDPAKESVNILADMLGLLVDIAENPDAFLVPLSRFGDLKIALERALLEFKAMFDAFGTDLVDGAVAGTRNATMVTDALSGIVDVLVALTESRGVTSINLNVIGFLKLALERAFVEFDLMFKFLGRELMSSAIAALDNTTNVTDALTGIIEVLSLLTENRSLKSISFDTIGQLKLALERAFIEFDLMFRFLGQDLINNATQGLENATAVTDALTGIVEVLEALVGARNIGNVDFEVFGFLKLAIERAFIEFDLLFDFLGPELIGNATTAFANATNVTDSLRGIIEVLQLLVDATDIRNIDFEIFGFLKLAIERVMLELDMMFRSLDPAVFGNAATAVENIPAIAEALTGVIDFLVSLHENIESVLASQKGLEIKVRMLADNALVLLLAFQDTAHTWGQELDPVLQDFSTSVQDSMEALSEVLSFLVELVESSTLTFLSVSEVAAIAKTLSEYARVIAEEFEKVAHDWDSKTNPNIESFSEAASNSLGAIADVGDALESILAFGSLKKKPNFSKLAAEMAKVVDIIVRAVQEVSKDFQEKAMEALGTFADNAGKAVGLVGDVADAMEAITGLSKITVKQVAIFKSNFQVILDLIVDLKDMAKGYLDDAIEFAEIAKHIAEALKAANEAIETVTGEAAKATSSMGGGGVKSSTSKAGKQIGGAGGSNASGELAGPWEALNDVLSTIDSVTSLIDAISPKNIVKAHTKLDSLVRMMQELGAIAAQLQSAFISGFRGMEGKTHAVGDEGNVWESLNNTLSTIEGAAKIASEFQKMLKDAMKVTPERAFKLGQQLGTIAVSIEKGFASAYASSGKGLYVIGQAAGNLYTAGLAAGLGDNDIAIRAAVETANSIRDNVNTRWGISSPAKVAIEQGQLYIEGLLVGIKNRYTQASQSIIEFATFFLGEWETHISGPFISAATNVGVAIITGLSSAIAAGQSSVVNAVVAVVQAAIAAANEAAGISSPSRAFMEIGGYMMDGLAEGLTNATGQIEQAITTVSDAAIKAAQDSRLPELTMALQSGTFVPNLDTTNLMSQMQSSLGNVGAGYMNNTGNVVGTINVGDININSVNDPEYDAQRAGLAVIQAINEAAKNRRR